MKLSLFAGLLLVMPPMAYAQGQTIWRCGADGRSYSATPCAEGRALEPVLPPSPDDQAQARRVALVDERMAAQLRNDRLREEAAAVRARSAGFKTSPPGPAVKAPSAQSAQARRPGAAGTSRAAPLSSRHAKG